MGSYKSKEDKIPVKEDMGDLFDKLIAQIMNSSYISPLDDLDKIKEDFDDHINCLKMEVEDREWILGIKKKDNQDKICTNMI